VIPSLTLKPVSVNDSLGALSMTAPVFGTLTGLDAVGVLFTFSAPSPEPPHAANKEEKPRQTSRNSLVTRTPIKRIVLIFKTDLKIHFVKNLCRLHE
jgi:hypothetical protein